MLLTGRTALRAILADRCTVILEYRGGRLDALTNDADTSADRHLMIDVAQQSIRALRADLSAPAQPAAAGCADHLLRRLFAPVEGKYAYKATSRRVTSLSELISSAPLPFLAILREFATLMPVPKLLTEWWPNKDMPLLTFHRRTRRAALSAGTR